MKILLKLLRNYDCHGPVTPGDPGHILMRHMLNSSQFLKKVMINDYVIVFVNHTNISCSCNSGGFCRKYNNVGQNNIFENMEGQDFK